MKKTLKTGWKAAGLTAVLVPSIAAAVTQTMAVHVEFGQSLSTTQISSADFGVLKANTPAKYTLSTSGAVTTSGDGEVIGGTPKAGNISISGSNTQNLDITVGNYTANNNVTPSNAYCSYDGGGAAPCKLSSVSAPGSGKTLLVGLDINVGNLSAGTTASPGFDINVNYN